jgi:hypothetical protein
VRARICIKCQHRDALLFDAINDAAGDGQFDLVDVGRGRKMRQRGRRVPDLWAEFRARGALPVPELGEGEASDLRAVVARLDDARVERHYISPRYLREPLARFVTKRPRGLYWLQAPAHVGKTTFVQGLAVGGLDDRPLIPAGDPRAVAIVAFLCKREYRPGVNQFLSGLVQHVKVALGIPDEGGDVRDAEGRPVLMPETRELRVAADRRAAFAAWLDAWRDFARLLAGRAERPRLLLIVDGLDEAER